MVCVMKLLVTLKLFSEIGEHQGDLLLLFQAVSNPQATYIRTMSSTIK